MSLAFCTFPYIPFEIESYKYDGLQANKVLNIPTVQRKCQGFNIQSWKFTPCSIVCVM